MRQLIVYINPHFYPLKKKLKRFGFDKVKFLKSFEIQEFDPTIKYTVIALFNYYPKTCENETCLENYTRTALNFLTLLTQKYLTEELFVLLPDPVWMLKNLELQKSSTSLLRQFCNNRGIGIIPIPKAAANSSIHLPQFQLKHQKLNQLTDSIWNQIRVRV